MNQNSQTIDQIPHIALSELTRNIERINKILDRLSDATLSRKTQLPYDCGLYILGQLISRLDILLESLGTAKQRFHELEEIYISSCSYRNIDQLSAPTLRASWNIISIISIAELSQISLVDWFACPPDNPRNILELPRRSRISILLLFSYNIGYNTGRLSRIA
ncbi:hypothetical protein [Pseudochryseolinea flava]|uniref:Uncharacterized protein n=1 Tax=Pseudochryseolinea flava TaxID=2059302 RepID=A0A364Y895_9BACT|nr:hypothetical protein [Pseudochryseolinea flava]RAW02569.1 hypothetical protein DQQ10_00170 [Pseudochryseolinea flava]